MTQRSERELAIDTVQVVTRDNSFEYGDVEEMLYAERVFLLTARDPRGDLHRVAFPYERIEYINTTLREELPVINPDLQPQEGLQDGTPKETIYQMMERLNLSVELD